MRVPNRTAPSKAASNTDPLAAIVPAIELLAELVAVKVAEHMDASKPRYADTKHNPIGSRRAFLDAARRGDFPTFKLGRCVAARWADVEAYIESRTRPARVRAVNDDDNRALLENAGVQFRPSNRRTARR